MPSCTGVGLDYLNNRHYDPTAGVFVSVDPLVTKTMQPYLYGAANPVTYSDPSGLDACSPERGGGGGCGGVRQGDHNGDGVVCDMTPDACGDTAPQVQPGTVTSSVGADATETIGTEPFEADSGGFWQRIGISYSGCFVFCADVSLNADGLSANLGGGVGIMVGGPTITYSERRTDTPWGDDGWPARWSDPSAEDRGVMLCGAVVVGGCYSGTQESGATWSFGLGAGVAFGAGQPKANVDLPWFWGD